MLFGSFRGWCGNDVPLGGDDGVSARLPFFLPVLNTSR